jgi:putative methionine-R-sulfoxide reductase with GAF domain/two-component sensor histidine kinase
LFKRLARFSRLFGTGVAAAGLVILIWEDIVAFRLDALIFTFAAAAAWLFESFLVFFPYLQNRLFGRRKTESGELTDETLSFPVSLIYRQRSVIRFFLLGVVVVACGVLVIRLLREVSATGTSRETIAAIMFYFFGITFLARMQHVAIRSFAVGLNWKIWFAASIVVGAVMGYGLVSGWYSPDPYLVLPGILLGFGITWVVYVDNRLGITDKIWAEVLQDISMNLMKVGALRSHRNYVVDIIGNRLRYERVFLLEPSSDRRELRITAEFGDYPSVKGKSFPSDNGITGHVFTTGKVAAWNDVRNCPYYYQLIPSKVDTTRSEIAVPIQYRGEIYGVLDIQSRYPMVYAPADIRSLETIANILGMSMAIENADLLLAEANDLWNKLSQDSSVEAEAFNLIADFGLNKLGADLVIYYPLSPTGHPFKAPHVIGKLLEPDQMNDRVSNLSSPLVRLIDAWAPRFEPDLNPESIFSHRNSTAPPFTEREKIRSVCFIPIGTKNEKLGIIFLNYRRQRDFDSIYRLTVMAFAQAFATLASKARYRQIVFEGFGRPDLGVHNIQAKYGLKKGILLEGRSVFATSCRTLFGAREEIQDCGMFTILRNVDEFLSEIRAQTTVEFDIWNRTLREAFQDFTRRMKEQSLNRHIWFITDLDPQIERESPWTRLALYRILTEAVNNAVFHGRTMEVDIVVQRRERSIYLRVINDGHPFPVEARHHRSRGGIFTLLDELKSQFGAFYSIKKDEMKSGTILEAEFPALPLHAEVNLV